MLDAVPQRTYGLHPMDTHDDIEHLFKKVEKHFGEANEGIRQMFAMLIHETLAYRDKLVHEQKSPLTVYETQRALDVLMEILKTKTFPEVDDERIRGLVMRWLGKINTTIHH